MKLEKVIEDIMKGGPRREVRLGWQHGSFVVRVVVYSVAHHLVRGAGEVAFEARGVNLEDVLSFAQAQTVTLRDDTVWCTPDACAAGCDNHDRPYCHCQACGETGVGLTKVEGYCALCMADLNNGANDAE